MPLGSQVSLCLSPLTAHFRNAGTKRADHRTPRTEWSLLKILAKDFLKTHREATDALIDALFYLKQELRKSF
jgi:hypothetical protein